MDMCTKLYQCGILTVSDSCFYDKFEDGSGRVLCDEIKLLEKFNVVAKVIVPDEIDKIETCLVKWADEDKLDLILTTGGTGFTARDVTPEATTRVLSKAVPSISQALLIESLKITKFAILSRGVSGIRGSTLIINFPGSPKAAKECLTILAPILSHALDQLVNRTSTVKNLHSQMQLPLLTRVSIMAADVANRSRSSQFPLFTVPDAQQLVFSKAHVLPPVVVGVSESLNMVTANAVKSRVNVPPFPASIKDGYAVRFEDSLGTREVLSVSNAGDDLKICVSSGTCVRISTGAKVPDGADAVVQVEDTILINRDAETGAEKIVDIKVAPSAVGQDIRPIGNDLKIGDIIIDGGTLIGPAEIGLMAMGGVNEVECIRQPVIGILSTGNELVNYSDQDIQNRIIDCNRPLLISLFKSHHFKVKDLGIVQDEPQFILNQLLFAFASCDIIVTTGGVSMGEKDYMQSVICQDLNAEIHFGRIFMKPGKPMTFSTICNNHTNGKLKLIFSLPGNPVSAFVTSYLFVIPTSKKISGYKNYESIIMQAQLKHDIKLDPRPEYRRCRIFSTPLADGTVRYEVSCKEFGNQMSSRLASCVAADGLVCLPSSKTCQSIDAGTIVSILKL